MAIYQRGNNWYIDFTFKGQRIRESIGPSRKGAEKVIAKRKTEIIENKYLDIRKEPDPIKFHDFAKEYLQWARANKKPSTIQRDLSSLRVLDKEFETKNIQKITTWQIEKYKVKRKEEVKPGSVNCELALLKHIYTKAIEWGRCKENPAKRIKLLKGVGKRLRFLMPDEIQTLLSNCPDPIKPIVTVALHTGARKGELRNLKWDEVDFNLGIISLIDTKNGERRDIPMNETVKAILKGMDRKGDYVFCKEDGQGFVTVKNLFKTALRKSGIEDFHFHDLRHTFASNLVMQEGVELNDIRALLGHKKMDMTLRYAHLLPKHKTRVVNRLDQVMWQIPSQTEKVVQLRP